MELNLYIESLDKHRFHEVVVQVTTSRSDQNKLNVINVYLIANIQAHLAHIANSPDLAAVIPLVNNAGFSLDEAMALCVQVELRDGQKETASERVLVSIDRSNGGSDSQGSNTMRCNF